MLRYQRRFDLTLFSAENKSHNMYTYTSYELQRRPSIIEDKYIDRNEKVYDNSNKEA